LDPYCYADDLNRIGIYQCIQGFHKAIVVCR